jgi:predicted ATPase
MRRTKKNGDEGEIYVREKNLRYRVEIEISPKKGLLRVADEYLAALNSKGEPTGKRNPFFEKVEDRIQLRLEGQGHPTYNELYLDHTLLSRPVYPPHYPHLVAMRQELASWYFFYFEPRERMRLPNPVKEVRHIGLMGEELAAFLNTLKVLEPQQFKAVERALHTVIPSINGIEVGVNHIGQVELNLREGATAIPASLVSEGTLRLLGLLALGGVKEPASLIGFEEPENGIHPRRIQLIAEYLKESTQGGQSQIVVTTHSPLLPDLMPEESLYACRKVDGKTQIGPFHPGPLFKQGDVQDTLDAESTPMSTRILRGDFDA